MHDEIKTRALHENLDTSYVNLSALLRYLQARDFTGRVHVELDEYDADVFLSAGEQTPQVRETDHAMGRTSEGEEALRRLLVRASAPGGLISVYEGEAQDASTDSAEDESEHLAAEEGAWRELLPVSGDLIAAVERAALAAGVDFAAQFRAVRLEMADDYAFLDPGSGRFEYAHGMVRLRGARPSENAYVPSIIECMHRVVERMSRGARARSVRERVALELAVLARRKQSSLEKFKIKEQLDRIAGTRVL